MNLSSVPKGYWTNKENARAYLKNLESIFGVKSPRDWGQVTVVQLGNHNGWTLLRKYKSSVYRMLQDLFPSIFHIGNNKNRRTMEKGMVSTPNSSQRVLEVSFQSQSIYGQNCISVQSYKYK